MYETLAGIERQLAAIELDYLRKTYIATRSKFLERATAIDAIPDFWSTVIDEAPAEIDQRIQPRDVPALNCLVGVDLERFEIQDADHGEPRSIKLTLTFRPNEWLSDERIEKRFYWRTSANGWSGLVSEPVRIHWKNRDLTDGLLDLAINLWKKELEFEAGGLTEKEIKSTKEYVALIEKVQRTPQDAISFFGLFGFRGRHVSVTESVTAVGKKESMTRGSKQSEQVNEELSPLPDTEIYPHGEELVTALSEDLYPGATHYYTTAKERDARVSDEELVNSSDLSEESDDQNKDQHEQPPYKKMKISA
ncbi:MAG: hypothetical protein L6R40_003795 [Gallowayella cf. fulva]|nr:MAG: hypothetical protein L6R40_003795 [Xanthomendoza cf. fulva]